MAISLRTTRTPGLLLLVILILAGILFFHSQKMLAAVLVLAIAATLLAAVLTTRALIRPIEELVEGTRLLADGVLDHQVPVRSNDDIGLLARSFNEMARQLKISRHEILTAKSYADNIIRSMTNLLVVVDRKLVIQRVNKAVCDLLEYPEAGLTGLPLATLFAAGYFEESELSGPLPPEQVSDLRTSFVTRGGRAIQVLFSSSVMRDECGDIQGIVCVAQDITMQNEAMRAGHLASLGELAAGVAHEINNPVNGIINFAQLMLDELHEGNKISEEMLHRIIKEGDRVSVIVSSLLSFARNDDAAEEMAPIQARKIMDETLPLVETQIRKEGIVLKIDIPPDLPSFRGHFHQLLQVFLNIVNNARYALNQKYPGAHPDKLLMIGVATQEIDDRLVLQISFYDRGIGIPKNIVDKVVNPFFSTKPAGRGTGLGLAISHGIVTAHGGKMYIVSREGEFCLITLMFPLTGEGMDAAS